MAQPRTSHVRPLSADFPQLNEPSMLYSILPSSVQSRLPRLPSLRRSASMYGLPTHRRASLRAPGSGTRTPETEYKGAMVLTADEALAAYRIESASDDGASNVGSDNGRMKRTQFLEVNENTSGIGWKFANQGLSLLCLSADESSQISDESGNPGFTRQLYIHSLTYLLKGLPTDLTPSEQLSIRSSIPSNIGAPLTFGNDQALLTTPTTPGPPSLLHRALAAIIVYAFIFIHLALPYIKTFLSSAYAYDREHKLSEKIMSQGMETFDLIGKGSLSFGVAVCGVNDGKVGKVMGETARWIVEGVVGGVNEGLGEGISILKGDVSRSET